MIVRLLMFAVFVVGCQYGILAMWLYHRHKIQELELYHRHKIQRLEQKVAQLERQFKS